MAADTSDISEFKIKVIPSDEDGCCFYLERYKPFRLASLKQDPDGKCRSTLIYFQIMKYDADTCVTAMTKQENKNTDSLISFLYLLI